MALRGPRPALLLPLVLLAACLVLASGQPYVEPHFKFLFKHVDYPKTPAPNPNAPDANDYCNKMMQIKGLYGKPIVNTFIHEPVSTIISICKDGGTPIIGGLYESKVEFSITQCIFNPDTLSVSYVGVEKKRKIIVGCWSLYPVYYLEQL
ncbi:ribonuclease-like [Mauremys mutica]|uniref:ribonuclease-like n=1 Tax=Mauremys mutica TaxID=74926 RepID=UPI001D16920F|nr:ribonuclease-like [Mauremys mutica]